MKDLLPITQLNALEVFSTPKAVMILCDEIHSQATDFVPDVTTAKGRKEIASQAYLVSQSKTFADKAGKALTDEWTQKVKTVNAGRKTIRDFCDNLRDEIRAPLEEYKAEQERIEEEERLQAEKDADEIKAHAENDLMDREAKMAAWEEQQEKERREAQAEKKRKEVIALRAKRDARIRRETKAAAAQAVKDAKAAKLKAEKTAKEAREKARLDAAAARKRAKEAAQKAKLKAEDDKKKAVALAKLEAEQEAKELEAQRLRVIESQNLEDEKRAADRKHRGKFNTEIVDFLVEFGIGKVTAKKVVTLVAEGKIPHISIRY